MLRERRIVNSCDVDLKKSKLKRREERREGSKNKRNTNATRIEYKKTKR
jgi:hypothetical protein